MTATAARVSRMLLEEDFMAIGWQGLLIGALVLISYIIGNRTDHTIGMSMAFITMSTAELFHSFNIGTTHTLLSRHLFDNPYLWVSFGVGMALQFIVMYVPGLNTAFTLNPLNAEYLGIAVGLAFVIVLACELVKAVQRHTAK